MTTSLEKRLDVEGLAVGDHALGIAGLLGVDGELEVGAQAAGVHEGDLGAAPAVGRWCPARRASATKLPSAGLDATVLGAGRGAAAVDVGVDLTELRCTEHVRGVGHGLVDDGLDLGVLGEAVTSSSSTTSVSIVSVAGVDGQLHPTDLLAVLLGRDDRAGAVAAGDRHLEGVGLVGVAAEDGVDVLAHVDELTEDRVGRDGLDRADVGHVRALVGEDDDHVGLAVGVVAVLEVGGDGLGLGHRVGEGRASRCRPGDTSDGVCSVTTPT